ncbi:MAG TPA: hypothetical protein DEO71_03395 [Chryseobacterium sp.]|nr:hypothetical protein [Chryseobacterium sp.]
MQVIGDMECFMKQPARRKLHRTGIGGILPYFVIFCFVCKIFFYFCFAIKIINNHEKINKT